MDKVCTFDIGGTSLKYCLVDEKGEISNYNKIALPDTYEKLLDKIFEIYRNFNLNNRIVCISSPCNYYNNKLNGDSFVTYLPNKDLIGDLTKKFDLNVLLENDGNCAMLGEKWCGNAKKYSNVVTFVIGSGIGSATIINDKLLKGRNNQASEIGYLIMDSEVSEGKLIKYAGIIGGLNYNFKQINRIDSFQNIEDAFDSEDETIITILEEMCKAISILIINSRFAYNPEIILIGGEISKCEKFMLKVNKYYEQATKLIGALDGEVKLIPTLNNNNSNLLGAASLYFNKIK